MPYGGDHAEWVIHEAAFYECAGRCVIAYQRIEDALGAVFSVAVGAEARRASTAWAEVRNLDAKLKVILRLFELDGLEAFVARWHNLSERVKSASDARAEIAHGALTIFGGGLRVDLEKKTANRAGPQELELHKPKRGAAPSRWNVARMTEEVARLDALYSDLLNLIVDLRESS